MGNIQDLLAQILSARYGRDVRQSIHDAIETCYEDGHAGAIDLEARTLLGNTDISGVSETVTGAVVELNGAVETAQTTADEKLNTSDAWKIGTISVTEENVSIDVLGSHTFVVAVPEGVSNAVILRARSADQTRTLIPINGNVTGRNFRVMMSNQSSIVLSGTMTIEIIYAYK